MQLTWDVLERAKDCQEDFVINACRRVINAGRLGWRRHRSKVIEDYKIVMSFAE